MQTSFIVADFKLEIMSSQVNRIVDYSANSSTNSDFFGLCHSPQPNAHSTPNKYPLLRRGDTLTKAPTPLGVRNFLPDIEESKPVSSNLQTRKSTRLSSAQPRASVIVTSKCLLEGGKTMASIATSPMCSNFRQTLRPMPRVPYQEPKTFTTPEIEAGLGLKKRNNKKMQDSDILLDESNLEKCRKPSKRRTQGGRRRKTQRMQYSAYSDSSHDNEIVRPICPVCVPPKTFSSIASLVHHYNFIHKYPQRECPYCKRIFENQSSIMKHMKNGKCADYFEFSPSKSLEWDSVI
ncbi:uncharacterized protein LOC110863593 isoform X2 [Folsomia candida]|uniref:uncharacterized protein LOC110863593 isoform X2 n=1 Tax=Folsomia candida TaxID=158441 RepID=UPI000B8F0787|nr:uncharacterized protein LOC110863593 isoform X2 [Folsomia candida]